ncbi:hypothetical protein [Microbacterium istanbulense]|uniref:Uncharacterized protein n=1 Tax=Microbacterium istanbulense TaxID=3122049 RepID=A0ABU8LGQ6_9MICO
MTGARGLMAGARGLRAAVMLGVVALALSGCVYAQIPADDGAGPDPVDGGSPSAEPLEGGLPEELTFAAGQELPDGAYIQWGDGFIADEGWEIREPDNGHGEWMYGTTDGRCTARFWQGLIRDSEVADEGVRDDEKGSDLLLASVLDLSEAELAAAVMHDRHRGGIRMPTRDARRRDRRGRRSA